MVGWSHGQSSLGGDINKLLVTWLELDPRYKGHAAEVQPHPELLLTQPIGSRSGTFNRKICYIYSSILPKVQAALPLYLGASSSQVTRSLGMSPPREL